MTDFTTAPAPLPLTLVTGFLGAGKTTLLNRLLKDERLAGSIVIVNEFGEIGLDHLMIEGVDDGMILLASGCLCCTIKEDLLLTLEDLLRRRDNGRIAGFERVIIETTGLADPAPILNLLTLHPYLSRRYRLDGVVTLIDAVNAMATLDAHEEALRQAVVADRLVLTKADLVADRADLAELSQRLARLNPGASIIDVREADAADLVGATLYDLAARPEAVGEWLAAETVGAGDHGGHHHDHGHGHHHGSPHRHDVNRHDAHIRAFTLVAEKPVARATFELFWALLRSTHGSKLLRLKGLVALAEHPWHPLVVHAVQQVLHPPLILEAWPDADRRSRLVLIVKDLDASHVQKLWAAFLGQGAPAAARAAPA